MTRHDRTSPTFGLLLAIFSLVLSSGLQNCCASAKESRNSPARVTQRHQISNGDLVSDAGLQPGAVVVESRQATGVNRDELQSSVEDAAARCQTQREDKCSAFTAPRRDVYLTYLDEKDGDNESEVWRYRYLEEPAEIFQVNVLEESLDERLANIVHTIVGSRLLNLDFFRFNSGNARQDAMNMERVAGPQVDDSRCRQHLEQMLQLQGEMAAKLAAKRANSSLALDFDERHLRLARVLDSYGRYESGHLSGKMHSLGQYDQCTSTSLILGGNGEAREVGTRYCLAGMDLNKHLNRRLRRRPRADFEPRDASLMVAICLPRSCHTKTFAKNRGLIQRLVDSQFRLPPGLYIDETLQVDSIFCLVDSESRHANLPLSAKLVLVFLASWLALAAYATYFAHNHRPQHVTPASRTDNGKQPGASSALLDCLNLRKSWQDWLGGGQSGGPKAPAMEQKSQIPGRNIDLDALNVIRVLGCAWVILVHSLIVQSAAVHDFPRAAQRAETNPAFIMLMNGSFVVELFFVITGLLTCHSIMKQPKEQKNDDVCGSVGASSEPGIVASKLGERPMLGMTRYRFFALWLKNAVTRYLRLVPLYFLVFCFKKSVLVNYLSGSPLSDAGFNKNTAHGACRLESWASPLTMMAAFAPLMGQCVGQAWSVANDLFFSLTITPIILILPRRPKLALFLSVLVVALGDAMLLNALSKFDPHQVEAILALRTHAVASINNELSHLYTYPQFRFGVVLSGVMAGYFLFKYSEDRQSKAWPRWFSCWATKLSLTIIMVGFSGAFIAPIIRHYIGRETYEQVSWYYLRVLRVRNVWSLCFAVLLMRLCTDWRQNPLVQLFSGNFGRALARLNYAIFLIHMEILYYFSSSSADLSYFSTQNVLADFGHTYFYCIPLAIFLHVVYENPMEKLIKRFVVPKLFAA